MNSLRSPRSLRFFALVGRSRSMMLSPQSCLRQPRGLEGCFHFLLLVGGQGVDRRAAGADRHAHEREGGLDAAGGSAQSEAEADGVEAELGRLGRGMVAAHE